MGIIQKLGDKIKGLFSRKEVPPMLPQGDQKNIVRNDEENEFLKSIRVSPDQLIKSEQPKKVPDKTKQKEDESGPNLDD